MHKNALGFRFEVLGFSSGGVGIDYGKAVAKKGSVVHKMCTFFTEYDPCKFRLNTRNFYTIRTQALHTAIHTWVSYFSAWLDCKIRFVHTIPSTNNNNHFLIN